MAGFLVVVFSFRSVATVLEFVRNHLMVVVVVGGIFLVEVVFEFAAAKRRNDVTFVKKPDLAK